MKAYETTATELRSERSDDDLAMHQRQQHDQSLTSTTWRQEHASTRANCLSVT